MNTIDLRPTQPAVVAVAPRPKTAAAGAPVCTGTAVYAKATKGITGNGITGNGITGNGIVGSWLATSRLSMTVPAFHDRRPLCST